MHRRFRSAALIAASLALVASACHEATTAGNAARMSTITAAEIGGWVGRLADDSMRGRATPSAELERAASVAAARFAQLGLRGPFAGGAFLQTFPVPPGTGTWGSASNVAAVLDGSDPTRSGQYVVIVAHLDGLGVGTPVDGDSIYNGADDDASGCAAVLELAEALAGTSPHPRRSIVFFLTAGEEEGLWGATWFVGHSPIPIADVVAVVALDMIARGRIDTIQVGGWNTSTLTDALLAVQAGYPALGLKYAAGPLYGSDHVPFYGAGIPFVMFYDGESTDYHTPFDEAALLDTDKAARVTRTAFLLTLAVASDDARPTWRSGWPQAAPHPTASDP